MKDKIILLVIFVFLFSPVTQAKLRESTKKVSVELELEAIPDTQTYEIEVKKISGKKTSVQSFSQQEPLFRLRLKVGNYLVRTRIITKQAQTGPWSDWSELLAKPENVHLKTVVKYNIGINKTQQVADLKLNWDKSDGADQYVIWIENLQTKKVIHKTVSANSLSLKLELGEYKIGIQALSKEGVRSDVKYFDNSFYIAYNQLPAVRLQRLDRNHFKWDKQKEAEVRIDIFRKAFFGNQYSKIKSLKEDGEAWRLPRDLEPGEYKIEFQYVSEVFENGPVNTVSFLKKPNEKDFSVKQ